MELAAICEVLQASQQADAAVRKAAEQRLEEAKEGSPGQLAGVLCAVLAEAGKVAPELRQEAAVILRQCVMEKWDDLQAEARVATQRQMLLSVEGDPAGAVQRSAGSVVSAVAQSAGETLDEQQAAWPELWPWLARLTGGDAAPAARIVALRVLKELVPTVGDELIAKGDHIKHTLARTLSDQAMEIKAAGAQLALALIQYLQETEPMSQLDVMPAVTGVIQALANSSMEKELEETLEALVAAAEAEAEFFTANHLPELWETLMKICNADGSTFGIAEIRHTAMEAAMSIAEDASDGEDFKPYLESLVEVNFKWMLELEEDVGVWTAEGKEEDDDDCDDDTVRIGEENFDRLATNFEDGDLMPIVFKVITAATENVECSWKCVHSSIMAISQVMEHLDDDARVDQGIDFIMRHLNHQHPRVRYAGFTATGQTAYDQSDEIQAKYAEALMPMLLKGMQDENIRVVTAAVEAFGSVAEDMDGEDFSPFMGDALGCFFQHLGSSDSRVLQEKCVDSISAAAEAAEELFEPYYGQVMPLLKKVIVAATSDEQRKLRGKAFLCASGLGKVVGKDAFMQDARELMDAMLPMFQAGFAADNVMREHAHEAAGNIIQTIGKDFKGYVPALLPSIFAVIQQAPKAFQELVEDDETELDELVLNDLGTMGLKTSDLTEMDEALELIIDLAKKLEEEFCEFLAPTCSALLPMLDLPLSSDVRETVLKTWGQLASSARAAVEKQRLEPAILSELVATFLKNSVGQLAGATPADVTENNLTLCSKMQTVAEGTSDFIKKAGEGVLTKEVVKDVAAVIGKLLAEVPSGDDPKAQGKSKKKAASDDDEDDEEEDDDSDPTPQTVRFALADVIHALMRANREDFAQQVLPAYMQLVHKLVQASSSKSDRSLGFYIAAAVTDCLGEGSVQYWQGFMNEALIAVGDTSPMVQRYATKVVGAGARQRAFSVMLLAAAQSVFQVLQKHGEKHKRRRVKKDQQPVALAIDACVEALGQICEHNEQALGEHAGRAWTMWLHNLPLKYDTEGGRQVHAQVLRLLAREHPVLVSEGNLSVVLRVLAEVHKTKFSTPELDKDIAFAFAQLGPERIEALCSGFKEVHKNKTQQILKNAKSAGGA